MGMKNQMNRRKRCALLLIFVLIAVLFLFNVIASAAPAFQVPKIGLNIGPAEKPQEAASTIQIILILTVLSIAPAILIMMTSFTRIIIILSFLRNALGTQQMPPNQVLIGLALFITFAVMSPVISDINKDAYQPFAKGQITQQQAIDKSSQTIKTWMIKQIFSNKRSKDLELFMKLNGQKDPIKVQDAPKLPLSVVVPAFLISEMTIAFKFGFLIYLPFLIIDIVVSSTLMSMGMMMLPPSMISLPFKILIFILVDGWSMLTQSIVMSFAR
jgi:flagellar biosynthetic protein FliP